MAHTFQWLLLPLPLICLTMYLIQMKNIWFSTDSEDIDLVFGQIMVFLWVFLTKICMSYDHLLGRPWIDGAFSGLFPIGLLGLILLSGALTANTIASYHIYGSDLLSMVCSLVFTLIEIWTVLLIVKILPKMFKRKHNPKSLSQPIVRFPEPIYPISLSDYYQKLFVGKTLIPIGWTHFSTTYQRGWTKSERVTDFDNESAFKIIDIKEYVRFHFGSQLKEDEEKEAINRLDRNYGFLLRINIHNNDNIIGFHRMDKLRSHTNVLTHLALHSKLAPHSLHSYLKSECPKGIEDYNLIKRWFGQIVEAVNFLHRQRNADHPIAHMNIKPENILLYSDPKENSEFVAKLSECGLDLYFPKSGQLFTDNNKYLISAPEYVIGQKITRSQRTTQVRGANPLATDIYNLGVILVLLLRGMVENFVEKPKDVPKIREMDSIVTSVYVDFSWKTSKNSVKKLLKNEDKRLNHLLKSMLERKPDHRLDIHTIRNHPWLQTQQN